MRAFFLSTLGQWLLFALLGLAAFYKIFSFWFYRGWETSWLLGITGGDFSLVNLMRSHGLVSYINYLLFGWRPFGWYATGFLFHIITAMAVNIFVSRKTNRIVGLIAGLLFLVTTAHHDVITWGSFESLYAVQTLAFYLGLWSFGNYRESKKIIWYGVTLVWFMLSLIIRESGLLFLPLVLLFDAILYERILDTKPSIRWFRLLRIARRHVVLWLVGLGYIFFRAYYRGSGHDYIDERVQFRILLFNERRYLEYIRYGLLSFGYFIGPYVIPYPFLNIIRGAVLRYLPYSFIKTYFFTSIGWIIYGMFCYVVWRFRRNRYARYLFFCLFAFTAVTLFYSFAWTVKDSFLEAPYTWSENRWRYLAFTFFASGASLILYSIARSAAERRVGTVLLVLYLTGNTVLLWRIQDEMYIQNSLPAIAFYRTFLKTFPSLTDEDRFFAFRASPGLNDFLAELSYIYPSYYPNLRSIPPLWARFEMYYILQAMRSQEPWTKRMHFIDYSVPQGVQDHTEGAKAAIASLRPLELTPVRSSESAMLMELPDAHSVEFRYFVNLRYQAFIGSRRSANPSNGVLAVLSKKLADLISTARISVCQTMGDEKEPYYDLRKELALDGNISNRSYWWANCRPAWITIDMGGPTAFAGAAWSSVTHADAIPRSYRYEVSDDGKNWKNAHEVRGNEKRSVIDVFSQPVVGRFIRLWIDETSFRQMVRVDEFVPLTLETVSVAKYYSDLPQLYEDMRTQPLFPISWIRVSWATKPDNTVPTDDTTMYVPIRTDGISHDVRTQLLESEFYSAQGQFLKRKLARIEFSVPDGVSLVGNHVMVERL